MLKTVQLLLPALIPSWRFFDVISPSPRIEFAVVESPHTLPHHWQEFRPRPLHLPFKHMLRRMFWNPRWNEALFLVSCAERLAENLTEHSVREIATRITRELGQGSGYMQFRLVFVSGRGAQMRREVTFMSSVYPLRGAAP